MEPSGSCRECGAPIDTRANYCSTCGRAIRLESTNSERRQLTVLFCDMVGSTQLSERLDPEDLGDLLNSYQRVCRDAIMRFEGHVSQFLGDGVLAYFGYPAAHEDDAVRAIRAALSILESIRLMNEGIGKRLQVEVHLRLGLHTGVVIIADGVSRLAVGETVNLAARIETVAPIDSVVVSAATASLVGGHFELESLRAQTLRGFTRPVELFRVVKPTGARTKFEAAARVKLTPHVDREAELRALTTEWQESQGVTGRAVLIRGEAGIGKSRMLYQFRQNVLDEGATVVECFCSPLTQVTSLAPIIEMLEQQLVERLNDATTPDCRLEALRMMLSEHSRFAVDALPLLASLLSISGADETPVRELSPVRRRARTLELLRDWLVSSAERLPVAVFFEDLQWADPSTLDFLDLLVRQPLCGRAMVCMTARPEFSRRWEAGRVMQVDLGRLPSKYTDSMIVQLVAGAELSDFMVRRIAERSEGVPLYIEELTKLVVDRLRANPAHAASRENPSLLPSTIRGTLEARLDQVGSGRKTAQLGAAIGRDFGYALIRAVAGRDDAELAEDLRLLRESELAFVSGTPPTATYTFKHALIQDAIYETIPKSKREEFHERIFTALTTRFPELVELRPEMAAHHAELAHRPDSAVFHLHRAGVQALSRQAVVEALQHLRHALELIELVDESRRAAMDLAIHAVIGPAYMAVVGWAAPEVERASARLLELATAAGDADRVYLGMWGLWTVHFVRSEQHAAIEIARKVYDMATATGDPMLRITGCHALGYTSYCRADFVTAKRIALEALSLSTIDIERQMASMFQLSSGSISYGFCAGAQWLLGEQDQAAELTIRWHELLNKLKHAPSTALSLAFEGYLLHMQREPKKMRTLAMRLRTVAEQEGFQLWISMSHIFEAWALAHDGQLEIAVDRMNAAIAQWLTTSSRLTMCDNRVMQAEVLLLAGRCDDALAAIEEGKDVCETNGERTLEPELYRLQGEALDVLGRPDEAIVATERALVRAGELGALSLELRAVLQLHRLAPSGPSLERVRTTYLKFSEGFEKPDLRAARAYLDAGGTSNANTA